MTYHQVRKLYFHGSYARRYMLDRRTWGGGLDAMGWLWVNCSYYERKEFTRIWTNRYERRLKRYRHSFP